MSDFIPTDIFLAYLLLEREQVSFEDIWKYKERMKSKPDLDVDLSIPSIIEAIDYNPRVFHLEGNLIVRSKFFDQDYVKNFLFGSEEPDRQLSEFIKAA